MWHYTKPSSSQTQQQINCFHAFINYHSNSRHLGCFFLHLKIQSFFNRFLSMKN